MPFSSQCRPYKSEAIDSALALKEDLNELSLDNLENISSIDIETYRIASEHDNYNPGNVQDLKQSLPYAVAISLVSNDLSLDSIDELIDKGLFSKSSEDEILRIKAIANKINIRCDEELNQLTPEKRPSRVIIKYKGNALENTTYYPLGEVENPLREEDIIEKFRLLNPKFNMNKLQIVKHMEDYSINEVFEELDL